MNDSAEGRDSKAPHWLQGRGLGPKINWSFGGDGDVTCVAYARETGDLFVADNTRSLYRLDRQGRIAGLTRLHQPILAMDWADDGSHGAVLTSEDVVIRFDRNLKSVHRIDLPEPCLAIAISPFGNHLALALADGDNLVYNERKRRITKYTTIRPLSFLDFCASEATIIGAAEHNLLCCHTLGGAELWQQKNWSTVGEMATTGDGDLIYLASFGHGIQTFDGDGATVGAYVLEGTVSRVGVSFEPQRLIAGSIEQN
ncbi:MAG: hypothetical protein KDA80_17310, partial [Planctomycetaceae bacterium]|nr:hypothetical protein [Planctomycetaceae bacterium]